MPRNDFISISLPVHPITLMSISTLSYGHDCLSLSLFLFLSLSLPLVCFLSEVTLPMPHGHHGYEQQWALYCQGCEQTITTQGQRLTYVALM